MSKTHAVDHRSSSRVETGHTLATIGFRASLPQHTDLGGSVRASRRCPGRFNTDTFGALYLCRAEHTALAEFQDNDSDGKAQNCVISVVHVALDRLLDFGDRATMAEWSLTEADLRADDITKCQRVAERAIREGIEAIQWPSATGTGISLAVFFDRLLPSSTVELIRIMGPGQDG